MTNGVELERARTDEVAKSTGDISHATVKVAHSDRLVIEPLKTALTAAGLQLLEARSLRDVCNCASFAPSPAVIGATLGGLTGARLVSRAAATLPVPFILLAPSEGDEVIRAGCVGGAMTCLIQPLNGRHMGRPQMHIIRPR